MFRSAAIALALCAALAAPAVAEDPPGFSFAAMGDTPYLMPQDDELFAQLIDRINGMKPAFSIHVGDIKSGSSPCDDATFLNVRRHFDNFQAPLFYTPGDNEWTDCHRRKAGAYEPHERLARLRQLFFAEPKSFGRMPRDYLRQTDAGHDPAMVENGFWTEGVIPFATVHVVGSANGRKGEVGPKKLFRERNEANVAWIDRAFEQAISGKAPALVIAIHANPGLGQGVRGDEGFDDTLDALVRGARRFGGPVLLIHGDTHTYRTDRPIRDRDDKPVNNIWRLEVPGAPDVGAVMVTIDPSATPPFAWQPVLVTYSPPER
ncbi:MULTISPECIES: hypothetical protein [unclassified Minwuia]|uniref:hypothetical protein n=1 Tax=unclassified Minwuia TaxID=2618799 RepID=UPI002479E1E0|nr:MULTISPECIES: hypothetical protein [unclassified Minwuia]